MINRYRRISFSWRALILGTESAPAPRRTLDSRRPNAAPRSSSVVRLVLQGATFTGLSHTRENFPMLPASTTFRAGSGVSAARPPWRRSQPTADGPTNHCVKFVLGARLVNAFIIFALIYLPAAPPLGSLTPADAPLSSMRKICSDNRGQLTIASCNPRSIPGWPGKVLERN
jgi:hypothetical protein